MRTTSKTWARHGNRPALMRADLPYVKPSHHGSTVVQYAVVATIASMFIAGGFMSFQPGLIKVFTQISDAMAKANTQK
jgi:Flp pilus assembly pilin Flp